MTRNRHSYLRKVQFHTIALMAVSWTTLERRVTITIAAVSKREVDVHIVAIAISCT